MGDLFTMNRITTDRNICHPNNATLGTKRINDAHTTRCVTTHYRKRTPSYFSATTTSTLGRVDRLTGSYATRANGIQAL